MKTNQFLSIITETLEIVSVELTVDTEFATIYEYDSMGRLGIISILDEYFNLTITSDDLSKIKTVKNLIDLVGDDKFED